MSNRFKEYRKLNQKKVSDEELSKYSLSVNNSGVKHDHPEWKQNVKIVESDEEKTDKEIDIERNEERQRKAEERRNIDSN